MKKTIQAFGLVQGVSQQPDSIRLMGQGSRQENARSSLLEGLVTRYPTEWIADIGGLAGVSDPLYHVINRDPNERYIVEFRHQSVKVWDVNGVSVPVKGPSGPWTPDFSTYLSLEVANSVLSPVDFTSPNWTLSSDASTPSGTAVVGPLGYGTAKVIGSKVGAVAGGTYSQVVGVFATGPNTFSVYVRYVAVGTMSTGFTLELNDDSSPATHTAAFSWASGTLSVGSTTGGATSAVTRLSNTWWRASITMTPGIGSTAPTAVGNARSIKIRMADFNASAIRFMHAWGARVDASAAPGDYVYPESKYLKALTIADYTFLLNTRITTARTAATATAVDLTKTCYLFVRAGNYNRTYTVTLKKSGGTDNTFTSQTWDGNAYASPCVKTVSTEDVAQDICDRINSTNAVTSKNGVDYSGNGIAADGWAASRVGSVVKITRSATNIEKVTVGSSDGDRDLLKVWTGTSALDDLPLVMDDGMVTKVQGAVDTNADDYYVKFVSDTSGVFGPGHWVETIQPGAYTTLDGSTMPWKLVRKQDDGFGTVTGTANAKYFEWAPVTWTDRAVGDDTTNPLPSFVGKTLNDIFFFKNRLGLAAGQNVVMSEVSRFFNFFRNTVLVVPDNDPIDLAVPHTRVVSVNHAVPYHDRLVLFSELTHFVLSGDPTLTPKTVQVVPIHEFESHRYCRPVATTKGLFYASPNGDYTNVGILVPMDQVDSLESYKVTQHVPRYIPGEPLFFSASSLSGMLTLCAKSDRTKLYVYNFAFDDTTQIQSAWSIYTFGSDARVLGTEWIENTLYIVVQTAQGATLYKMVVADGLSDPDTNYVCRLDRRVKAGPDTSIPGVFSAGVTTWSWTPSILPNITETPKIVTRASSAFGQNGGTAVAVQSISQLNGTITASGDYSNVPVWIGFPIAALFEFSRPFSKTQNPYSKSNQLSPEPSIRLTIDRATLSFSDTGAFDLSITPFRRSAYTESYAPTLDTPTSLGQLVFKTDTYRFGVHCLAKEAQVVLSSSSHLPFKIGGIEWEVQAIPTAGQDTLS